MLCNHSSNFLPHFRVDPLLPPLFLQVATDLIVHQLPILPLALCSTIPTTLAPRAPMDRTPPVAVVTPEDKLRPELDHLQRELEVRQAGLEHAEHLQITILLTAAGHGSLAIHHAVERRAIFHIGLYHLGSLLFSTSPTVGLGSHSNLTDQTGFETVVLQQENFGFVL